MTIDSKPRSANLLHANSPPEKCEREHYHYISVPILAGIMHISEKKVQKLYRKIIENDSIPLKDIPLNDQQKYVENYLLRDRIIDFSFINTLPQDFTGPPLTAEPVRELFREMQMMREAYEISLSFSHAGTVTEKLRALAKKYGLSYSTLARRRKICFLR